MSRLVPLVLAAVVMLAACQRGSEDDVPADCGLPKPRADIDISAVPAEFLIEGTEPARSQTLKGRVIVALNADHSVNDAFELLKRASEDSTYDILQEDNEGFEAELYLKQGRRLAAIQIRTSVCPDKTAIYLNFPAERRR